MTFIDFFRGLSLRVFQQTAKNLFYHHISIHFNVDCVNVFHRCSGRACDFAVQGSHAYRYHGRHSACLHPVPISDVRIYPSTFIPKSRQFAILKNANTRQGLSFPAKFARFTKPYRYLHRVTQVDSFQNHSHPNLANRSRKWRF